MHNSGIYAYLPPYCHTTRVSVCLSYAFNFLYAKTYRYVENRLLILPMYPFISWFDKTFGGKSTLRHTSVTSKRDIIVIWNISRSRMTRLILIYRYAKLNRVICSCPLRVMPDLPLMKRIEYFASGKWRKTEVNRDPYTPNKQRPTILTCPFHVDKKNYTMNCSLP